MGPVPLCLMRWVSNFRGIWHIEHQKIFANIASQGRPYNQEDSAVHAGKFEIKLTPKEAYEENHEPGGVAGVGLSEFELVAQNGHGRGYPGFGRLRKQVSDPSCAVANIQAE